MNIITRTQVIEKLKEKLESLDFVYALWLEGADASGLVDKYSDIDFWVDFEDEYENEAYEAVEDALTELSQIDYKYVMKHGHPKIRQRIYHLSNSSEYLMIDFCWQLHSRPANECKYIKGNLIEAAMIIFDKANVIKFVDNNPEEFEERNSNSLADCKYRYSQHTRVKKYIMRGQYLEAYAYYHRYVFEPLVDLLRMIYTPANTDLYLVHISHHIPEEDLQKLEYFAQLSSLKDISEKMPQAEMWFIKLLRRLEQSY